jgi:molybdate transport system substrate-binding protein
MRKVSRPGIAALTASVFLLGSGVASRAADIKVLAVGAFTEAFKEIVPPFEKATGHKATVQYAASPVFVKQIEAGEPLDVAILVSGPLEQVAKQGFVTGERPAVSAVGLGAAVRAGAPKPDIGSADAFKQSLLKAKSVAILPESVNGKHFLGVFDRLGISDEMKAKIKAQKDPSQMHEAVAKGEAELVLFISNALIGVPGVDYVGPVPAEFQQKLVFTAAVSAKAKEPDAASAFIKHLRSPAVATMIKAHGMDIP